MKPRMEGWMEVGGWLGGRWGLTIYFLLIVQLGFATPGVAADGCKLNNICNLMLKV